ncbi:MAG: ABC transporter ATP-binding protein, partial [Pseudomonadota bacterium]
GVIVAAQPTWGVDVGAAQAILQRLADFRASGVGIILISDELDDLLDVADRLHVLFRGRLSPSISRADARIDLIGAYMAGEGPALHREVPA